ncbi:hypothetical protein GOBAR_DD10891 [Gossypium barbadense]|nr:hypothetical protein GOBAR_DD10891 [Gossypium barbadense]
MARCAPKCEKTVEALLCQNLNVKSATLPNATSSRRIRLQDDLVTGFQFSVSERFVPRLKLIRWLFKSLRNALQGCEEDPLLKNWLEIFFWYKKCFYAFLLLYRLMMDVYDVQNEAKEKN